MSFIYDNLIAVMLAGAVLLILIGVGRAMTESSVEAVQTRADAVSMADLDAMIGADLSNLGGGVPADQPVILTHDWTGSSRRFEFRAATPAGAIQTIRYTLDASTAPGCPAAGTCFTFARFVDAGSGFAQDGGSASHVREMTLDLISPSGVPDEARVAEVALSLIPRYGSAADGASVRERVLERRVPLLNLRFRQ